MIGVILAGGYATRLKPLTDDTPKHLLPINGRPMIDYLYDALAALPASGVAVKYILVTNHKFASHFRAWVAQRGYDIDVIDDGTTTNENRLGALGDQVFALSKYPSDDIFIIGADNLTDFDFVEMHKTFLSRGRKPLIGVFDCGSLAFAAQCGVVSVGANDVVTSFVEKPASPPSTLISTLFYMFPASALPVMSDIVRTHGADKGPHIIDALYARGPVYAYVHHGYWFDIGTHQSYAETQDFMRQQK